MRAWLLGLTLVCAACAPARHYQSAAPKTALSVTTESTAAPTPATPSRTCDQLDTSKLGWLIASATSGALAGTGGLASLPVTSTAAKDGLAGAGVAVGVLSAVSAVVLNYYDGVFKQQNCVPAD